MSYSNITDLFNSLILKINSVNNLEYKFEYKEILETYLFLENLIEIENIKNIEYKNIFNL